MTGKCNTISQGGGVDDKTTPDYIKSGLIALYDGIKNTRNGHNKNSLVWEDLSGNDYDLTVQPTIATQFNQDCFSNSTEGDTGLITEITSKTLSTNITVKTVEIVLKSYRYGISGGSMAIFILNKSKNTLMFCKQQGYGIKSGDNVYACDVGLRHSISINYNDNIVKIDNVAGVQVSSTDTWSNPSIRSTIMIYGMGGWQFTGEVCSLRIYDKVLTAEEIAHNFAIDKKRFEIETPSSE